MPERRWEVESPGLYYQQPKHYGGNRNRALEEKWSKPKQTRAGGFDESGAHVGDWDSKGPYVWKAPH